MRGLTGVKENPNATQKQQQCVILEWRCGLSNLGTCFPGWVMPDVSGKDARLYYTSALCNCAMIHHRGVFCSNPELTISCSLIFQDTIPWTHYPCTICCSPWNTYIEKRLFVQHAPSATLNQSNYTCGQPFLVSIKEMTGHWPWGQRLLGVVSKWELVHINKMCAMQSGSVLDAESRYLSNPVTK